jgi:hypothetical protein
VNSDFRIYPKYRLQPKDEEEVYGWFNKCVGKKGVDWNYVKSDTWEYFWMNDNRYILMYHLRWGNHPRLLPLESRVVEYIKI